MEETTTWISTPPDRNITLTLRNQAVEVLVTGALNSEVAAADIVDRLVVNHEAAVRVFEGGVRGENRVVRLDNRRAVLRRRVHTEFQLALLSIVDRQTLHQQCPEPRARTTTERVENKEALEATTVVRHPTNLVENLIDHLLADCVVTPGIVVGCILLTGDHLLRMKQLSVGTGADLVDDVGFEVGVNRAWDVFASG